MGEVSYQQSTGLVTIVFPYRTLHDKTSFSVPPIKHSMQPLSPDEFSVFKDLHSVWPLVNECSPRSKCETLSTIIGFEHDGVWMETAVFYIKLAIRYWNRREFPNG